MAATVAPKTSIGRRRQPSPRTRANSGARNSGANLAAPPSPIHRPRRTGDASA